MSMNKFKVQSVLVLLMTFVSMNPLFVALGIKGIYFLSGLVAFNVIFFGIAISRRLTILYGILTLFLITSTISTFLNNSFTPVVYSLFFSVTILSVASISKNQLVFITSIVSKLFYLLVFLAILAVIAHLFGVGPFFQLNYAGGRPISFYLGTFSSASTFVIRPSAIYDEPGAFSFFICIIVVLRSLLKFPEKGSYFLLFGGLITQSIVQVVFIAIFTLWLCFDRLGSLKVKSILKLLASLFMVASLSLIAYQSGILSWNLLRAASFVEIPELNPRYRAYAYILETLQANSGGVWAGFDSNCADRNAYCSDLDIGENILTPLSYGGVLSSWPYYLFIAASFLALLVSHNAILLIGVSLMLAQRPYLLEFPYSSLLALVLFAWFYRYKSSIDSFHKTCDSSEKQLIVKSL